MLLLLLGAVVLFVLIGGMKAFERASVKSIKALAVWIAALGGLSLALLLILSGRGSMALGALVMFGPLVWRQFQAGRGQWFGSGQVGGRPGTGTGGIGTGGTGPMTRQEAYQILGLQPGASEQQIREAHIRLMRTAHPDVGGSEWIATRINQARDILLG